MDFHWDVSLTFNAVLIKELKSIQQHSSSSSQGLTIDGSSIHWWNETYQQLSSSSHKILQSDFLSIEVAPLLSHAIDLAKCDSSIRFVCVCLMSFLMLLIKRVLSILKFFANVLDHHTQKCTRERNPFLTASSALHWNSCD